MSDDIKTMKLYHHVERVFNELRALGIEKNDPLSVETLSAFDQYHYHGTDAVDEAIDKLGIDSSMRVLEVGGGIGGPSRYLANISGCHMTALELQADLNTTAQELTLRCRLENRVTHVCGDILNGSPAGETFDALVSWLTFLHISDRVRLYQQCFAALKPGAGFYVEDFFARAPFTALERDSLRGKVYCEHVPGMQDYRRELGDAGFEGVELIDKTASWAEFVSARRGEFERARERNVALHGVEVVDGLSEFYSTMVELFEGGNLGGICVVAWKPK
jgi:cyclopropane fatty-acyl-phospholipid synthase-like methyltransferase